MHVFQVSDFKGKYQYSTNIADEVGGGIASKVYSGFAKALKGVGRGAWYLLTMSRQEVPTQVCDDIETGTCINYDIPKPAASNSHLTSMLITTMDVKQMQAKEEQPTAVIDCSQDYNRKHSHVTNGKQNYEGCENPTHSNVGKQRTYVSGKLTHAKDGKLKNDNSRRLQHAVDVKQNNDSGKPTRAQEKQNDDSGEPTPATDRKLKNDDNKQPTHAEVMEQKDDDRGKPPRGKDIKYDESGQPTNDMNGKQTNADSQKVIHVQCTKQTNDDSGKAKHAKDMSHNEEYDAEATKAQEVKHKVNGGVTSKQVDSSAEKSTSQVTENCTTAGNI